MTAFGLSIPPILIGHTEMAAEGAKVLHDGDAPSPEAKATNPVVEELRKVLIEAFGTAEGEEALSVLRKEHKIHSLRALRDKLLKDDKFEVGPVCTDTLRDRLGIDDLRAKEAEATRKAKDEEQKKEREARAAETAKEEAKQLEEAAHKKLVAAQGGALGSSVCVR
jgi:hypothetical protein